MHRTASEPKLCFEESKLFPPKCSGCSVLHSFPERNNCLISSYIQSKMTKCEHWMSPHNAERSKGLVQSLSPRQGWQSEPQQPAQRTYLSQAGHRHPFQPFLSCYIPVTRVLARVWKEFTQAMKSWTHASKPCPAREIFLRCFSLLCCLNSISAAIPALCSPAVPTPRADSTKGTATQKKGNGSGKTQDKSVLQNTG